VGGVPGVRIGRRDGRCEMTGEGKGEGEGVDAVDGGADIVGRKESSWLADEDQVDPCS
jgi:hypothetical protein